MAKTALVISGGGSKGAFAVGVLRYVHQHVQPIDTFDVYCGTSTGALIVPLALCGELSLLEQQYTTLQQRDLLNLGSIGNLVVGISIHDATPLKNRINELITDQRFNTIQQSSAALFLATVCLQTEQLVHWANQTPNASSEYYAVEQFAGADDLRRAMLASSCQPVFMQPIEIRPGTQPVRQYVDGGVREITPIQVAIDQGADTIIAISLGPHRTPADDTKLGNAFQILQRTLDLYSEDVGASDYHLARLYQRGNQYLQAVKGQLLAQGVSLEVIRAAFAQPGNPLGASAVTTIHEIRPDTKLEEGGPGGLTFDSVAMQGMLNKGFDRAKAYFESPVA
jgi:predicted acylesterase/phospholipase RssA